MKNLALLVFLLASSAHADISGGFGVYDANGNGITSQASSGQQALDIGINVLGVQVDPRNTRALTSAFDSISCAQGTSPWVTSISNFPAGLALDSSLQILILQTDGIEGSINQVVTSTQSVASSTASMDSKLTTANSSLASIVTNTGNTASSVASIDIDFDVALSTRASASNQLTGNISLTSLITAANQVITNTNSVALSSASIDSDIDVALSTRASSANQSSQITLATSGNAALNQVLTNTNSTAVSTGSIDNKLTTTNSSLSTIATSTGSTATSVASIDTDFDVALSTRASAANQVTSNATLANILTSSNQVLTNTGSTALSTASMDSKLSTTNSSLASHTTSLNQIVTNTNSTAVNTLTLVNSNASIASTNSSIDTKLTTTNSSLSGVMTNTNSIASNTVLLITQTDTLESLAATGNSNLSQIITNTQSTVTNTTSVGNRLGDLTETAPASDTASSGLNGRMQRIAQRLSTLITAPIAPAGVKSTVNSSTAQLAASANFTGTGESVLAYQNIQFSGRSDQAGSYKAQWSNDGVTYFDDDSVYTLSAGSAFKVSYGRAFAFFRPNFTNTGGSTTTTFFISVIYDGNRTKPSSSRIGDMVGTDSDAELIKASLTGVALTPNVPMSISIGTGSTQAVAQNLNRKGLSFVNASINRISCAFGVTAILNAGVTLYPGGTYTMDPLTATTSTVNCIASGASSGLSGQEYQ